MIRTDSELVSACREGDESAWEAIVYKYQNLLFSIPRRAGLGKDLASDVLQDVYITLFKKLDSIEKPEFLRAWLITTTKHKTIHLIKRETRGKPVPLSDENNEYVFDVPDKIPLADEAMIRLEQQNQIENALTLIEERCRRLLTMLYLEEEKVPYTEVADTIGIPLGSIGPTRARCLEKLLKLLPDFER
jgi:RNA polymerase sigma factor (sigma-70 family)